MKLVDSWSSNTKDIANQYIKVENNRLVLDGSARNVLSANDISKINQILSAFNEIVNNNNITLTYSNDNNSLINQEDSNQQDIYPFISFTRSTRRHHHSKSYIVGYGSNGYCYKDSKGNFHYVVTKHHFKL